jgi:predicted MFS family arabinose efflux permease
VAAIMTVSSAGAAWVAQRALTRFGTRGVAVTGLALLVLTCLIFAAAASSGGVLVALAIGMVVFGFGMGGAFVAGSVASLQDVEEQDSGVAAGVQNISFTVGTTFGVALLSTVSALTSGFAPALLGGAVIAAFGLCASILVNGRTSTPAPVWLRGRRR